MNFLAISTMEAFMWGSVFTLFLIFLILVVMALIFRQMEKSFDDMPEGSEREETYTVRTRPSDRKPDGGADAMPFNIPVKPHGETHPQT